MQPFCKQLSPLGPDKLFFGGGPGFSKWTDLPCCCSCCCSCCWIIIFQFSGAGRRERSYSFTQYFRVLELLAVAAPTVALPSVFTFHILLILARLLSHTSTRIFSVNQSQGQAEGLYKPGTAEPCSRATNEKSYCEKSTEKVFGIEAKKAVKHKIKVRERHKKGKRA